MSLDCMLVSLPIRTYRVKKMIENYDFSPSIGLMSLYSILKLNGYSAEIIDLIYEPMKKDVFLQKVVDCQPKMLGISAYSENIAMAIRLAEAIKIVAPDVKIALGGAHVSLNLTEFKSCEAVDFAMIREGEGSIVELMAAISTNEKMICYENIEGIAFRRNSEVIVNEIRPFITALDLIPLPCRDYFGMERFKGNKAMFLSTSRGCPNRCIYCSASALSGKRYRVRDIRNVYLEIIMLQNEVGIIPINIVDDSFTVLTKRVEKFLDLREQYHGTFYWACESIVRHMSEELLARMSKNGLVAIQYGIESANQEVLNKILKGIDINYAEKIIKKTHEFGVIPIASFMFGHFCETRESAQDTIAFIKKISEEYDAQVAVSYNTPFPGTYQYEHAEELGMKIHEKDYRQYTLLAPIVSTKNFRREDQVNWFYQTIPYQNRKTIASSVIKTKEENHNSYERQHSC